MFVLLQNVEICLSNLYKIEVLTVVTCYGNEILETFCGISIPSCWVSAINCITECMRALKSS